MENYLMINGVQIPSGTSGTSGINAPGTTSGSSGTSGNNGTSGTSGNTGTHGTSGSAGTSGNTSTSGSSGISPTNTAVITFTGTTQTFQASDAGKLCLFSSGSAVTATIPASGTTNYTVGTRIDIIQSGVGKVTFAGGTGTVIYSQGSNKAIAAQNVGVSIVKTGQDVWYLVGNLIA